MDENEDVYNKNLYRWKKHNSKLNSKIKESDNIREQTFKKIQNSK